MKKTTKLQVLTTSAALKHLRTLVKHNVAEMPKVKIPNVKVSYGKGDEEELVLLLSDIQVGHMTPTTNARIIGERMERLAKAVIKIVSLHSKAYPVKKLHVFLLGDMIQSEAIGFKVDLDELEMVVKDQIFQAVVPFTEKLLLTLLPYFPDGIECWTVSGNHGDMGRFAAPSTNWDTIIYRILEARLQNYTGIRWHIQETEFYQKVRVMRKTFLLVHGDQIPMYLNIPHYGVTQRAMRWQGSLPGDNFDYMVLGHFHVPTRYMWNNVKVVINGCFVSEDRWVLKKIGMSTIPTQVLFGVHPRKGMTFYYELKLDE